MKSFSKLNLTDSIDLANSNKDKFIIYGSDRVSNLLESGTLNNQADELFRGKNGSSVLQILEQFYKDNYNGNYDVLVEMFNVHTETINEQSTRLETIISNYAKFVNENVNFPASQTVLKEAIDINADIVIKHLITEGYHILSAMDVRSVLGNRMFESSEISAGFELKDDPNHILGLTESLARAVTYVIASKRCSDKSVNEGKQFMESLNNIYSIYKEGIDLVKTNETQASELFNQFLNDKAITYNFSIQHLNATLNDPAAFVQYALCYYEQWIKESRNRLSYKFSSETFTRLSDMYLMYNSQHPMLPIATLPEYYFTQRKMLQLLDILLGMSQMLRMDLRNLLCKYITTIRPLIESYYRDFHRSTVRTGF